MGSKTTHSLNIPQAVFWVFKNVGDLKNLTL